MKVWQFNSQQQQWRQAEVPTPQPAPGEVLIRVAAAGVTPTELLWYPTAHTKTGEPRPWAVPGHEFAGTVATIGQGVDAFRIGDAIYGMSDWFADGATAEFCITRPEWIAPRPPTLSVEAAAVTPIGALTAWQGLFERAKVRAGERVLVQGGSGSVGSFAVQLAHAAGATVVATASEHNADWLRELGAHVAIDYRHPETMPAEQFDVVFDTVGGETLARGWDLLRPDGRMISIAADQEGSRDERNKAAFFIVELNGDQLRKISERLDRGELKVSPGTITPFDAAPEAYSGKSAARGKGVVRGL